MLQFNGALERDPAIDAWMKEHAGKLGAIAYQWFDTGKFMRHVMRRPGTATNAVALSRLIDTASSDIKARVENG